MADPFFPICQIGKLTLFSVMLVRSLDQRPGRGLGSSFDSKSATESRTPSSEMSIAPREGTNSPRVTGVHGHRLCFAM